MKTMLNSMVSWRKTAGILLVLLWMSSTATGLAQLVCEVPTYDFGDRYAGEKVERSFLVTNAGDRSLDLTIKSSCGCLVGKLSKKTLAPGENATVSTSVSLQGTRGLFRKDLVIISNGASPLSLSISGRVRRTAEVLPEQLDLGEIAAAKPTTANIFLVLDGTRATKITSLRCSSSKVEVRLDHLADPAVYRAVISIMPSGIEATIDESVQITTDDDAASPLTIPIKAEVRGPVAVIPDKVVLLAGETTTTPRYLVVKRGTAAAFHILGVDVPPGGMKADAEEMGEGSYRVRISGLAAATAIDGAEIILRTDLPSHRELRIPVVVARANNSQQATTRTMTNSELK